PSRRADALVDRIVTLPAVDGDLDYRVLVTRDPRDNYRVLAAPLSGVDAAVDDLVRTILITAAVVVVIGAVTSWLIVRQGLRPVDRMVGTASAIAAGDLSQRVEHGDDDRSELGRLAAALDDMLAQLERAFTERQESQARLEQFVADASHELRTPVAAIRGYAELYRRGGIESGESLDRAMARIEDESQRMGSLVEDLLLLARLDQHEPLDVADVDLAQLAADAVSDLRAVEPERPVTLEAGAPVVVAGDERRLRQVLANLLGNARIHTPAGTPVHVTAAGDADGATLVVADEGPGIGIEHRPRIFERFYRADRSRSRASGGAGLGLSIVTGVVSAHGGRLEVDSPADGGARFRVWLPRS
ncbi:MAG: sensor histidine kinase, partial [Acidimicrobiia bacterium]